VGADTQGSSTTRDFARGVSKPLDEMEVWRKSDDDPQNSLHLIIVRMVKLREMWMVGCVLCMMKMRGQNAKEKRKVECVLCMLKMRIQTTRYTLEYIG
jgi:hypothetical protein